MKIIYILFFLLAAGQVNAQKIYSIFVNLYTDSLKLGTYNYINIVGITDKGNFLPLDSSQLIFKSSEGQFIGNNWFYDKNSKPEKIKFTVYLKDNPKMICNFEIYIKMHEENIPLPLESDIIKQKSTKKS